jgi:uncharacterized protein
MEPTLTLSVLPDTYAVCRLDKAAEIPAWATSGSFLSITRTTDELSIVCLEANVPHGIQHEDRWRCLKIEGPLDFALTGILVAVAAPLAHVGISIFALSTYDTDYLMVRRESLDRAIAALERAGHKVLQTA